MYDDDYDVNARGRLEPVSSTDVCAERDSSKTWQAAVTGDRLTSTAAAGLF